MEVDQLNEAHNELESGSSKTFSRAEKDASFDQIFSIVPHYSFHQFLITMFGFYIGIIAGEVQVASVFFQVWTVFFHFYGQLVIAIGKL